MRSLAAVLLILGCAGTRRTAVMPPVPVPGHARVSIDADDASVRVMTAGIAQVEMQVFSSGYDPDDLELSLTPRGDRVEIVARTHTRWRWFDFTRRSLRLEVRTPRDVDLTVTTGDGSVDVDGIDGALDVHTGDGRVAVRGARGLIRLHTGDGSIEGRELDGSVEATTGDGSVRIAGRFDALAVETGDGSLRAEALPGSRVARPWHVQTGDGSVELALPFQLGAHIDASTGDGRVHSSIPLHQLDDSHVRGDVSGGGPPIVVRTGDGSIRLSQR